MKRKILITFALLLALTAFVFFQSRSNPGLSAQSAIPSSSTNRPANAGECLDHVDSKPSETPRGRDNSDIHRLLDSLKERDLAKRKKAKALILERAKISSEERQLVIDLLLQELASYTNFSQIRLAEDRAPWEIMVDTIGELRALEALPYLIQRLDWGLYYSDSHSGYRAFQAVVKLGKDAVPALSVSISDPSPQIRFFSVRALLSIEGDEAIRVLRSALEVETDPDIRGVISDGLAALDRETSVKSDGPKSSRVTE